MSLDTGRWEENSSQHNNMKSSIVVLDGSTIGGHHGSSNNTSGVGGGDGSRHRCTKHERNLTLLVILLSVLCFGLLVYLFVSGPLASLLIPDIKADGGFTGVCDSIECVDISYRSVHSGDFTKDPCQDFYSFACSKWQTENPIADEELYSAANINQIRDRIDLYLKRLLEKSSNESTGGAYSYQSPKAFYESCLNFSAPDESYIMLDLARSVGGYKSEDGWKDDEFDLTNVILDFLRLNAAPLFDFTLDIDPRDKTKYALIVELPRPTSLVPNLIQPFSRQDDILTTDKLMFDLTEGSSDSIDVDPHLNRGEARNITSSIEDAHIVDRQILYKMIRDNVDTKRVAKLKLIAEQIGKTLNFTEEEISTDVNAIALFAASVENIKPSQRSRKFWKQQNKVYNEFSVESLQRLFNNIDWKVLLTGLLGHSAKGDLNGEPELSIPWENVTIYVPYPDYLRRLSQVIQFTNKRLIFNGMLVMYVKDMLNDILPKKKESSEPRWKFCVHSTKSVFAMELSSLYLRSFEEDYLRQVRNDVEEIFKSVKHSLIHYLNRSHWQNSRSREESIRKVESLKGNFIGPSFYLQENYLDEGIKDIRMNAKDFFSNVKLVYKIFREQLYRLYWKKIDEDRATWAFVTFPTTVNAFYIQQFNSLVVPLAFLNAPHYVHGAPKYINYATIALTIAHEALHSLDSSGSDFDADGKLLDWLEGDNRGFLKEKSSCVAKQYSDHFRKIMPFHQTSVFFQVDGNLTQNENLADIAGLQVARRAYMMERQFTPGSERKLPGLDFNLDQLYFLGVAQAYCANISPMGYIFLLEMDEHTPHPERINGMLMNIPEFSKAFSCPVGSKMNPSDKCSLW